MKKDNLKKNITISWFEYSRLIGNILWLESLASEMHKSETDPMLKNHYTKLLDNCRKSEKTYIKNLKKLEKTLKP